MKRYEKESFLKSFTLFFTTLLFLNSIIFFFYFNEQKASLHVEIFNKIKLYNYNFKDKDMTIDIVPFKNINELYSLHITNNKIFAYFDIPNSKKNSLMIIYPYKRYKNSIEKIKQKAFIYFLLSGLVLLLLSIMYSLFAINPLKKALFLLDEFLKDIIHDLNTPISSILLNLTIIKQKPSVEAIKRIEFSVKKIGSLYGNLESLIKETPLKISEVNIKDMISEKISFYQYLYPDINFTSHIYIDFLYTSYDAISRILDNLISNACKYNRENGKVSITVDEKQITIEDTGIGIKNPKKVFQRYYKESDRGIGLGLNIVKKNVDKLKYKIEIQSIKNIGTKIKVTLR
ncbi:MAG: HAMP domain-containing sensor histidine kinase [Sulfurospirillum sp.]